MDLGRYLYRNLNRPGRWAQQKKLEDKRRAGIKK